MAEKIIQETPLPQDQQSNSTEQKDMAAKPDKPAAIMVPPVAPVPRISVPSFTKTTPNDLYRRLLPAVLFVLTFVTVMTMLLIYMDTVALGAQQFRVNMSRDYELARIPQDSPALVAFVRQLHLAPRAQHPPLVVSAPARGQKVLDDTLGPIENGTFIDIQPSGPRDSGCVWLQSVRGWSGLTVRAAARDYLALRASATALHACLSTTAHPREVTYLEPESQSSAFSSRVLCLPLMTVLLAADLPRADYVIMSGEHVPSALAHLPFDDHRLMLRVIEFRTVDPVARNKTTNFLQTKNYTVAASFEDSVMYALKHL